MLCFSLGVSKDSCLPMPVPHRQDSRLADALLIGRGLLPQGVLADFRLICMLLQPMRWNGSQLCSPLTKVIIAIGFQSHFGLIPRPAKVLLNP